jgi:hypothetical protein
MMSFSIGKPEIFAISVCQCDGFGNVHQVASGRVMGMGGESRINKHVRWHFMGGG